MMSAELHWRLIDELENSQTSPLFALLLDRPRDTFLTIELLKLHLCHIQAHPSRNYITVVISSPNYTSLPSTVATFLATCLTAVLQPSGYSIFHGGDTPIQLGLP